MTAAPRHCPGSGTRVAASAKEGAKSDKCPACGQKVDVIEAPSGESRRAEHEPK